VKKTENHQLQAYDIRITTCHYGWSVKDVAAEACREDVKGAVARLENCDFFLSLTLSHGVHAAIANGL